jgi:hypothetical protein
MKTYTYRIYHIPGIKVGATSDWEKRCIDNKNHYGNNIDIIILEEHKGTYDFGEWIGDREWEYADSFGYSRGSHYQVSRNNRPQWNNETRVVREFTKEESSRGGITSGNNNKESGHMLSLAKIGGSAKCKKYNHFKRKLTENQVNEIRKRYANEEPRPSMYKLSLQYNVSSSIICHIINNKFYY